MNRWVDALKKRENASDTNRQNRRNPSPPGSVSFVGSSERQIADFSGLPAGSARYADWTEEARRDLYEERAAIMEYDGGLSREEAEATAWREVFGECRPVQEAATGQWKEWLN